MSALGRCARWARRHLAWWIFVAGALVTALITLVSLEISFPGQSGATVSGLFAALVVLLVLSVGFPVAGRAVEARDRKAEQEARRQERAAEQERAVRQRIAELLIQGSAARLPRLSEVSNEVLGATPTRYSMAGDAPYVPRAGADDEVRRLLAEPGPPWPFVVVWGTTKAGKSRTIAEALRATFAGDPAVIVPRGGGQALAELVKLGIADHVGAHPAVVVLDNLDPAGLEALAGEVLSQVRSWAVVAATMTARQRADTLESGSTLGAAARAALAAVSGEYELTSEPPAGAERGEAERLYPAEHFDGSIAETLVGGRELIARYKAGQEDSPAGCAVVRAAIDVRRAGVSRPVTAAELRQLFPLYLRALRIDLAPTDEEFADGIRWATHPVTSQVALLRPAGPGWQPPSWQVFDHAVTADEGDGGHPRPVPAETWTALLGLLRPQEQFAVGFAAHAAGADEVAITALRQYIGTATPDQAAITTIGLGALLSDAGDVNGARAAFQQAIDSRHPDATPMAAAALGELLWTKEGDVEAARAAFQQAIDSRHPDAAPMAAASLGLLLQDQGDVQGARQALQQAINSHNPQVAPRAAASLAQLLIAGADLAGACSALREAAGYHDPEVSPAAAWSLGVLLRDTGDVEGARAAFQQAIDSHAPRIALQAATDLGVMLSSHGDPDGARAAYQLVIDSHDASQAPRAAANLGHLLEGEGDPKGAQAAYELAISYGQPEIVRPVAVNLGLLLHRQGDPKGALAAYQQVIDACPAEQQVQAALDLGDLLRDEGDLQGARAVYQGVVNSGHAEAGPAAQSRIEQLA